MLSLVLCLHHNTQHDEATQYRE